MPADRPTTPTPGDEHLPRQPGDVVGDRYRIVRAIARGGTGVVYEAEHTYMERRVALKMLLPRAAGGEAGIARFIREARSAARLSHPNIVEVTDMGRDAADGALFLVHMLLAGEDLEQRLERDGRLDAEDVTRVVLPVLDALAHAHAEGVLHRDLKPSNVFLVAAAGGAPVPRVIDFGASKVIRGALDEGDLTQPGALVGTPLYMAPEQIRGEPLDGRADLWAVGVIMHRALTGAPPFQAASVRALFEATLRGRAPRINDRAVPARLAEVVARALAPAREDRFPDARAMMEAIAAARGEAADDDDTLVTDTMHHETPAAVQRSSERSSRARSWPRVSAAVLPPISDELTNVPAENARVQGVSGGAAPPRRIVSNPGVPAMRVVAEPTPTPHAVRRPLVPAQPARWAGKVLVDRPVRMGLTGTERDAGDDLLRSVERALGRRWSLTRFRTYSSLVDALCEDEIELAWLPPVAYLRAHRLGPVHLLLALSRGGTASYGAAIVASDRSGIRSLDDVRGKRVVWVDAWSAAGYLMPCGVLREAGLDPAQVFASQAFAGSHVGVLEALEAGRADLGATYCTLDDDGALLAGPWTEHRGIRAVALSGPIPGDAICAAGELSLKEAEAIVEPLLVLAQEAEGAALLRALFGTDRFCEVDASHYHALEGG